MKFADSVIVSMVCPVCGNEHTVEVSEYAYYQWEDGALIQDVMPTLSTTEREQLVSHLCPSCQRDIFGVDDDPEVEEIEDDDVEEDVDACMRESLEFMGQWW